MTMSADRVKFFLPDRYLRSPDVDEVLLRAFGMSRDEKRRRLGRNPDGFWIICRPSQFARFIIFRARMLEKCGGGANGIKDLKADLIPGEACDDVAEVWRNPYDRCQYHG